MRTKIIFVIWSCIRTKEVLCQYNWLKSPSRPFKGGSCCIIMRHLFCHYMYLFISPFGALGRLYFMTGISWVSSHIFG